MNMLHLALFIYLTPIAMVVLWQIAKHLFSIRLWDHLLAFLLIVGFAALWPLLAMVACLAYLPASPDKRREIRVGVRDAVFKHT